MSQAVVRIPAESSPGVESRQGIPDAALRRLPSWGSLAITFKSRTAIGVEVQSRSGESSGTSSEVVRTHPGLPARSVTGRRKFVVHRHSRRAPSPPQAPAGHPPRAVSLLAVTLSVSYVPESDARHLASLDPLRVLRRKVGKLSSGPEDGGSDEVALGASRSSSR